MCDNENICDEFGDPLYVYDPNTTICRCDKDQLALFLSCSKKRDMSEWNEWRKNNPDVEIWLQGFNTSGFAGATEGEELVLVKANLSGAHLDANNFCDGNLDDADFTGATLNFCWFHDASLKNASFAHAQLNNSMLYRCNAEGSSFYQAYLSESDMRRSSFKNCVFENAHLENAQLNFSNLQGCYFFKTHMESTLLPLTSVDCNTYFVACSFDELTDFAGVALESAVITPELRSRFQANIRKQSWGWHIYSLKNYGKWYEKPIAYFLQLFWYISDYGKSTKRVFGILFFAILLFACAYNILACITPCVLQNFSVTGHKFLNFISSFCFSLATMVTLGFGGINVNVRPEYPVASAIALCLVTLNLFIGYLILAVLVTRLGIMFQSLAPEAKEEDYKIDRDIEHCDF